MHSLVCPIHGHCRPSPKQSFRYMDLPPEIRNRIAHLALTSDEAIQVRKPRFNRHQDPVPEPMFPQTPRLDVPLPRTPPSTPPWWEADMWGRKPADEKSRERDGHSRLALLMACRGLYRDHWATYYAENTFSFTLSTWAEFSERVPRRCLDQIRHVRFRMPYRSRHIQVWRALGELASLQSVEIVLPPPNFPSKLERVSCVQGVRFCENLRRFSIAREGVGGGIAPLADRDENWQIKEDRAVERSINRGLDSKWKQLRSKGVGAIGGGSVTRKERSRDGSPIRDEKRLRRMDSPDPQAVDEYLGIVRNELENET